MFSRNVQKIKTRNTQIDIPPTRESIHQLEVLVRNNGARCTWDLCDPSRYRFNCFYQRSHQGFKLHEQIEVNKYRYSCYTNLLLEADSTTKPELMHLARTIVEYFDRLWEYINNEQLDAREMLLKWIAHRKDILHTTVESDAEQSIFDREMRQV
jgi:hypothetical protein